ncbi:33271_t:CDS:2, partial [Gigaspora margarita]
IEEREWRAWKALLNHSSCTEITPYSKEQSDFEFWTRLENPNYDKTILKNLYQLKFFHPVPSDYQNDGSKLWIAIQDALDNNLRGPNGTQRILSIVANKFTYNEIQANLK